MGSNFLAGDWTLLDFAVEDSVTGNSDSNTQPSAIGCQFSAIAQSKAFIDARQRRSGGVTVDSFAPLVERLKKG